MAFVDNRGIQAEGKCFQLLFKTNTLTADVTIQWLIEWLSSQLLGFWEYHSPTLVTLHSKCSLTVSPEASMEFIQMNWKWPHLLCLTSTSPSWSTAAGGWAGYSKTSPFAPASISSSSPETSKYSQTRWNVWSLQSPASRATQLWLLLTRKSSRTPPSFPEDSSCWNEKSSPPLLKDFLTPQATMHIRR